MKIKLSIISIFIINIFFSQQVFDTDFVAAYNVEYPIYKSKNSEQFLLFIDTKKNSSFYRSTNQYVLDSLSLNGKINNDDFMPSMKYDTALGEEVLRVDNKMIVYEKIISLQMKYIDDKKINWIILNDRKKYLEYNTRKAYTFAFGRKWIAWFTEDIPFDFGPYKFGGLPGLIINMYDEKAEYFFSLSQFKKKVKHIYIPKDKNYKLVTKQQSKKAKTNSLLNLNGMIFENAAERKRMIDVNTKRVNQLPQLDIE